MVAKYRGSEFNEKQNICMVSKCPPTDRLWGGGIMDNWTNYHEDGYPMPLDVIV